LQKYRKTPRFDLNSNSQKSTSRITSTVRSSASDVIRSARSTGKWLRRATCIWPIIAAVVLGAIGLILQSSVERSIKNDTASKMETILNVEVAALTLWVKGQEKAAITAAMDPGLVSDTEKLLRLADGSNIFHAFLIPLRIALENLCQVSLKNC